MRIAEPSGANRTERDSLCAAPPAGRARGRAANRQPKGCPKGEAGGPSQCGMWNAQNEARLV
jgi:hypothetical protein